ncbi:glycosyltransferase [Selenomonas ruminantium]|nr:glycosyltransferase [Selenomonas ruminantium]
MELENQELLSLVVPVYNVEKYLDRCVQSLLNQAYKNIEIILVDDGAKDSSGRMCDEYAAKYPQIRAIHQENGGLGAARNTGVKAAVGGYIAFVDSDDWVKPDMYSRLMAEALAHPDADMVKSGYCEANDQEEYSQTLFPGAAYQEITGKENLCRYYAKESPWTVAWNTVYRQDLAKKVEYPSRIYHEDDYASFFYLYFSRKCIIINEPFYCYYSNPNSIVRDQRNLAREKRDKIEVLRRLHEYASKQEILKRSGMVRKLQHMWAKAYYHCIRDDMEYDCISRKVLKKVYHCLDLRRSLLLRYMIRRRKIKIL